MSELKPCPFCGEEYTDAGFITHTDDCYLMRRYIGASSRKELEIVWNIRPVEDALRAELAHRNVDLAQASRIAYDGEVARMKLEAELARRDAQIFEQKKLISGLENMVDKQTKKLYERDEIIRRMVETWH